MAKGKILVVDDEQDMAKALKVRLKANGYHVVLASDSVQAFVMAGKEKPDLIILDIMIPGGGGFVVAEYPSYSHHLPHRDPWGRRKSSSVRCFWIRDETLSSG
jgi:DNA-binding NtrC family response regulator